MLVHANNVFEKLRTTCSKGGLVLILGSDRSDKTLLLRQLKEALEQDGQTAVCKSLCVEKEKVEVKTLMEAMFYDLSAESSVLKIPLHVKEREQQLAKIIGNIGKPVVLIVDDAEDLPSKTVSGLGQLFELFSSIDGILTVVLAGNSDTAQTYVVDRLQLPISVFTLPR